MRRAIAIFLIEGVLIGLLAGCRVPPGQLKKQTAPGQIQKNTGYNPASGQYHPQKANKP